MIRNSLIVRDNINTKEKLIQFILNGYDWKHYEFSRYDIEIYTGKYVVASRIEVKENSFSIHTLIQVDANGHGNDYDNSDWTDLAKTLIVEGELGNIENIITDEMFLRILLEIKNTSKKLYEGVILT